MAATPPPTEPDRDAADVTVTLDAQALARLHELDPDGRHGTVVRVLATYESSLQRQLVELADARDRGDASAVGMLAHTLKSASASVGAAAFAARCTDVERRLREGEALDPAHAAASLLVEGGRALEAVRAMLRT